MEHERNINSCQLEQPINWSTETHRHSCTKVVVEAALVVAAPAVVHYWDVEASSEAAEAEAAAEEVQVLD